MNDTLFQTSKVNNSSSRRPRAWWLVYVPLLVLFVFAVAPLLLAWFTAFKTDQQQLTALILATELRLRAGMRLRIRQPGALTKDV